MYTCTCDYQMSINIKAEALLQGNKNELPLYTQNIQCYMHVTHGHESVHNFESLHMNTLCTLIL